jgi:VanZ family protein
MQSKYFSFNNINPSFSVPIVWLIISTVLLTMPGTSFPKENWLETIWFDKWIHIGLFFMMVVLWCWATLRLNFKTKKLKRVFIFLALFWLSYGIGMEFVQKYCVANRSFDSGDIIADALGCFAGLIFSIRRYIPKQNLK